MRKSRFKFFAAKTTLLQNLCGNVYKIFDAKLINFKAQCESLVKKVICRLQQLQDKLKLKDHVINTLITTIGHLTSSELNSKDNVIHKLINQNNCKENTNRVSINQSSTKITSSNI